MNENQHQPPEETRQPAAPPPKPVEAQPESAFVKAVRANDEQRLKLRDRLVAARKRNEKLKAALEACEQRAEQLEEAWKWPNRADEWRERAEQAEATYEHAMKLRDAEHRRVHDLEDKLAVARGRAEPAEVERLRQGLFRCAEVSGADVSGGIPTWPDIVEWAVGEVQQLRDDYDADSELDWQRRAERAEAALRALVDVQPYLHANPNHPHAEKWEQWREEALDKAAEALAAVPAQEPGE